MEFRIPEASVVFDSRHFLELLNGKWRTETEIYWSRLEAEFPEEAARGREYHQKRLERESERRAYLRIYVDEWLSTGIAPDGAEDPRNRDLTRSRSAYEAVWRSSQKQPLKLAISPEGASVRLLSEPELSYDPEFMNLALLANADRREPSTLRGPIREQADGLFTVFCLSSWRLKLAKCRRSQCGRYFELKHWNRTYERGTFCPECNANRSALECTKRRREWEHDDKVARATEAIREWARKTEWRRARTAWKKYVCGRHPDITAKSLTRWVNCGELKPPQMSKIAEA